MRLAAIDASYTTGMRSLVSTLNRPYLRHHWRRKVGDSRADAPRRGTRAGGSQHGNRVNVKPA